jgi:acyl-CoA thioesterase I
MSRGFVVRGLAALLAFAGLQLFFSDRVAANPATTQAVATILVVGDSISAAYGMRLEEGWVALLQKKLASQGYKYRVVNASVSGETTAGGLARLPRALQLHRPEIVILELGGNDGLRGLPLAELRTNLESMIKQSQAAGARVLLAGMRMPPNYGPAYTEGFYGSFAELARRHRLPLVPFFLDGIALNDALMQADGIHPNAQAQPALLDTLWPKLQPLLER